MYMVIKIIFKIKNYTQHRIKLIAGFSLLTKVQKDFLSVLYLLTLLLNLRNYSYTKRWQ